jgi:hypothetical protein
MNCDFLPTEGIPQLLHFIKRKGVVTAQAIELLESPYKWPSLNKEG